MTVQGLSSRARCEGFGAGTAYARATVAAAPAQRHVVSRCCRRQPITPHRPAHLLAVREGSCHLHYAFRGEGALRQPRLHAEGPSLRRILQPQVILRDIVLERYAEASLDRVYGARMQSSSRLEENRRKN